MSTFKSWSKLFVLVLLVFAFAGCGGGGGGNTSTTPTSDTLTWDTDPNPTTPVTPEPSNPEPTQPEPTPEPVTPTPEPITPEPTPEPVTPEPISFDPVQPEPSQPEPVTPEPSTGDTYTDTYNIASVLNGEWYGVSGSGRATDANGTYNLMMYSITATIAETQITGNTGVSYITYREEWDYNNPNSDYITRARLFGDNEKVSMQHIGSNTWQCTASDGTTLIIRFTSSSTAMITQEGTTTINGYTYQYSVNGTIQKRSSVDTTPITQPDANNYTDTYDIASVLDGAWYGVSGSGTAYVGSLGLFNPIDIQLSSMTTYFSLTQVTGDVGISNITSMVYVDYFYNGYTQQIPLYLNAEKLSMKHVDANTWELDSSNGTVITIWLTSETTSVVVQTGQAIIDNQIYSYSLAYTMNKL